MIPNLRGKVTFLEVWKRKIFLVVEQRNHSFTILRGGFFSIVFHLFFAVYSEHESN